MRVINSEQGPAQSQNLAPTSRTSDLFWYREWNKVILRIYAASEINIGSE